MAPARVCRGTAPCGNAFTMRGFLLLLMYAGGLASVSTFVLPRAGMPLSPDMHMMLQWGGLAAVVIGYVGRMVTRD